MDLEYGGNVVGMWWECGGNGPGMDLEYGGNVVGMTWNMGGMQLKKIPPFFYLDSTRNDLE
jgi:hypothetical protein